MTFREEFELLLRACYPLIYIPTSEEERLENAIAQCTKPYKTERFILGIL